MQTQPDENPYLPVQTEREFDYPETRLEAMPPAGNELANLHRKLRGRYTWLFVLGTIGAIGGAVAGIQFGHKTFQSVGQVHIKASVPKVMYALDEKGVPPMFESYMDAQVNLLRSQRVMDMAMQSPDWQQLHRERTDTSLLDFAGNLDVSRDGEILFVKAVDTDPSAAMVAVKTVIQAYRKLYDEEDVQSDERRLEALQARESTLSNELDSTRHEITSISRVHDTEDVVSLYDSTQRNLDNLSTKVTELQVSLAQIGDAQNTDSNLDALTADDIAAAGNGRMTQLLDAQTQAKRQVDDLRARNIMANNPQMQEAQRRLASAQADVDWYVNRYKQIHGSVAGPSTGLSANAIRQQLKIYQDLYDRGRQQLATLADQKKRIDELRDQESNQKRELDETQSRIEQLNVEGTLGGRVEVISDGDRPLKSFRDTRITYGAGAGLLGFLFGAGVVVSMAFADRSLRGAADAETTSTAGAMLGLLPKLPDDLSQGDNARMAAHCVHEIRTMLQIWSRGQSHRAFAVTSPVAGTGKTTLSFSLGLAFASPNNRTLLIDCDIIGGGLSDRAHSLIRSRIGTVLLNQQLITSEELGTALRVAQEQERRLGDVLVELGFATVEQVNEAAAAQFDGGTGLLDYLHGSQLDACVTDSGMPGLWVLPLGRAGGRDVPLLNPSAARRLLAEARNQYDTVIIDTGPTPGSLEASVIAAEADGVILVASKGENRSQFQKCVNHLEVVGARIAGVVFNRASDEDLWRFSASSSTTNSMRSLSSSRRVVEPVNDDQPLAGRFGPLAKAVSLYAPGSPAGSTSRSKRSRR